jgi:hypothetical protein
MVNVQIHQFQGGGGVVDASAMEQFQKQWATYQKVVDADLLYHREVGDILRRQLSAGFSAPFAFLDIACGDASMPKRILPGVKTRHYHGIDLSEPALELAAANLKGMPFAVDLDHRDFVEAMADRPEPADAAWCGLSIHHLDTDGKLRLLRAIRGATGRTLIIYEPARRDGEDRAAFLDRFVRVCRPLWSVLSSSEWDEIEHHVRTCDLPETPAVWMDLGRQAGFSSAQQLFVDPNELFRVFRYDL